MWLSPSPVARSGAEAAVVTKTNPCVAFFCACGTTLSPKDTNTVLKTISIGYGLTAAGVDQTSHVFVHIGFSGLVRCLESRIDNHF